MRLNHIRGVLEGQRCKGCQQVKKREDMAIAGEDPNGRPIYLCSSCRDLVGLP